MNETAAVRGWLSCEVCGTLSRPPLASPVRCYEAPACPECGAPVQARLPDSLGRTSALLVGALLLYLPSNLLPIMETRSLVESRTDTIWSGARYLWDTGSWPLAMIVVIASIVVPLLKLAVLTALVVSVRLGRVQGKLRRARLYRLVEFIGRWSMLDIYVVAVLAGVMQLDVAGTVTPRAGALAFSGVVVLTLLAAACFDPRLIWDPADNGRAADPKGSGHG